MGETSTTMMFEYNIKKLKTNPFHVDTAFGKPVAVGLGNEFERADKLQEVNDELVEALAFVDTNLSDVLKGVGSCGLMTIRNKARSALKRARGEA